jgi:hypothetical protein
MFRRLGGLINVNEARAEGFGHAVSFGYGSNTVVASGANEWVGWADVLQALEWFREFSTKTWKADSRSSGSAAVSPVQSRCGM